MPLATSPRLLLLLFLSWSAMTSALRGQATGPRNPVPLRAIAGGTFAQGTPESTVPAAPHEGPVRTVRVPSFSIGVSEVTVRQFRAFVDATDYVTDAERNVPVGGAPAPGCFSHQRPDAASASWVSGRSWRDPGYPQEEDHPVVCVSWRDARAYVDWLAGVTGMAFRLPSESEFEYVRRGGLTSPWGWQEGASPCVEANLADRSLEGAFPEWRGAAACDDGYAYTSPVDTLDDGLHGVRGLAGNVSEWMQDCWHDDYSGAPVDGTAWEPGGETECPGRVVRGGDFVSTLRQLRAAHRTWIPTEFRTYHVGFRVALSAGEP